MNSTPAPTTRPRPIDHTGAPGAFIDAMRRHQGLSFRAFAQQLKQNARGKQAQGSENYLYRLCRQDAALRPELIAVLARTLDLTAEETSFLEQAGELNKPEQPRKQGRKSKVKRLLSILETDKQTDNTTRKAARTLIDPVVIAVYTLLGKPRKNSEQFARTIAKATHSKIAATPQVRQALEILAETDAIRGSKTLKQTKDKDILVRVDSDLPDGFKAEALKLLYTNLDRWGIDTLNATSQKERYFQSQMFLVESEKQQAMQQELQEGWDKLRTKIRKKYESTDGNVVMHLGVRAWPMISFQDDSDQGGTDHA